MKQAKQRVIALDYFRGLCILMVVLNHSWVFSKPFAYLTGVGGLWTSAAELFFLISGLTLWIVRGESIQTNFKETSKKIWRRAAIIYLLNTIIVVASICLIPLLVSNNLYKEILGSAPSSSGLKLLWDILTFHYTLGLAAFLMYYSVYLLFAPPILYAMRTRGWAVIAISSALLFLLTSSQALAGAYASFGLWQFYFILGITLARFRVSIISWFYSLPTKVRKPLSVSLVSAAAISIIIAILTDFNIYPTVARLTNSGWLPVKLRSAYIHLLNHQFTFSYWLFNNRQGALRPLATLLILGAAYVLYQKYKQPLLKYTGNFVNTLGRDTLWVFVGQAIAIPLLVALPVPRTLLFNCLLTATLILSMWAITQRFRIKSYLKDYVSELRSAYRQAKDAYWRRYEENI